MGETMRYTAIWMHLTNACKWRNVVHICKRANMHALNNAMHMNMCASMHACTACNAMLHNVVSCMSAHKCINKYIYIYVCVCVCVFGVYVCLCVRACVCGCVCVSMVNACDPCMHANK